MAVLGEQGIGSFCPLKAGQKGGLSDGACLLIGFEKDGAHG